MPTSIPFPLRFGAALLAAALLAGCASLRAPDVAPQAGVAVPAGWSAGAGSANASSLADWWQRFDDPVLAGLVRDALAANTDLDAARAALRQARALADVQAAAGLAVDAGGSAQRSRSGGVTSSSYRAALDASWEPEIGRAHV